MHQSVVPPPPSRSRFAHAAASIPACPPYSPPLLSPLALPSTRPPSCLPPSPPTDPRWCAANPEACKHLRAVDLTGAIGAKRLCSVASHDVDSEQAIDLCILGHGGVHLVFESEGTAAPLDSPSRLYVTVRGLGGRGRGDWARRAGD